MKIYKVKYRGRRDGRAYTYETLTEAENIRDARAIAEHAKDDGETVVSVKYVQEAT